MLPNRDDLADAILRCNIVAPFDNGLRAAYSFGYKARQLPAAAASEGLP
jgi:hypothetical protein